jgi:signal transduction histidine kinase
MVLNLELLRRAAAKPEVDAETAAKIRRYAALVADEIPPLDRMLKAVVGQMRLADPPTTPFDLRTLCEEIAIVFDSYSRYRRLRIRTTLADVPMPVAGDRDAVAHAFTTLFLDAIDALPEGSELALTLQADRRQATVTLASGAPPEGPPVPAAPNGERAEAATAARETLERYGARVVHTSGTNASVLDITLPLAPLSS